MRKSIRLAVILSFILAVIAPAPTADADYWKGEVYYYSDACYTTVIGYFVRYCDNSTYSEGSTSAWSREYPFDCSLK